MSVQVSPAYPFRMNGRSGYFMRVLRSDGWCWGRVIAPDGTQRDVLTKHDQYEKPDEDAAQAFIRAALRGQTQPIMGYADACA